MNEGIIKLLKNFKVYIVAIIACIIAMRIFQEGIFLNIAVGVFTSVLVAAIFKYEQLKYNKKISENIKEPFERRVRQVFNDVMCFVCGENISLKNEEKTFSEWCECYAKIENKKHFENNFFIQESIMKAEQVKKNIFDKKDIYLALEVIREEELKEIEEIFLGIYIPSFAYDNEKLFVRKLTGISAKLEETSLKNLLDVKYGYDNRL